jgi:ATP-dependent DNA helicase RecQ
VHNILFLDTEIDPKSHKILDLGGIKNNGSTFHSNRIAEFISFIGNTKFLCGHNLFNHDLIYLLKAFQESGLNNLKFIDTLFLSPLLFPAKPYHRLLKDDKLQTESINNPLNDAIKAKDLFFDELTTFNLLPESVKQIYFLLLHDQKEFQAFFEFAEYTSFNSNTEDIIRETFQNLLCENSNLGRLIEEYPKELSYCLALIRVKDEYSITPPWVLRQFPDTDRIMTLLRDRPCLHGCTYCSESLDIYKGLKKHFGFDAYRTYADEPLQEKAVRAAVDNKSLLAIFPTGGGKSITFQVPALISGDSSKGLTVVISPLQSLMKDQVDNLEKNGITKAVTINGLLDPIERSKSFERVEDGSASILYISPESLRSKSIEKLLLGRKISRFVIDEAHCFSSWGQDFRIDYLYIGDFIKSLQEKKNLVDGISVSCFTATAKQKVIEDICAYFREKLSIKFEIFSSKASRTNLHYKVFEKNEEEEKYNAVRDLIEEKNCPTIIYVSRTRRAFLLAERLTKDGFLAKPYHGKMEKQEKTENQNAFISGDVDIMVATSAFGMGVDKKDVGLVVHYDISDSLENYIQEAGRAGRDENITADCFVLFSEEDLNKHFILLNQTKLSFKEIQQVWKAIKDITKFRSTASNSALEIARKAGWDESINEIETRVTTAVAALEDAGYLKRGQNMPKIFANSILAKTAQEAIDKIQSSKKFNEKQKEKGVRIIKKLFSTKSRVKSDEEEAESRIDYIADHLEMVREEVIDIINLLREENILADGKDLTAFIQKKDNINSSYEIVDRYGKIENFLLPLLSEKAQIFNLKALNETAENKGLDGVNPQQLKTILNFWAIKNWIKRQNSPNSKNHIQIQALQPIDLLGQRLQDRHALAKFIVRFLFEKSLTYPKGQNQEVLVGFSVHELKHAFENTQLMFQGTASIENIEDTLFYLSRIEAIKIEGGFLVVYNRLTIERLEQDNKIRYKNEDYEKLNQFYENKVQQIHIVGEYAKKMITDYRDALQFVEDYFQLNYSIFLHKYFRGRQDEIRKNITPAKFRQLFGELSPTQLRIIKDSSSKNIVVAAGPGSGKTRVLVHKLASLLLMEDVKQEQLLMLTFSRAAATEFKKRLISLIGNAALYVDIKTFHSYCFDILGKVGNLEKSAEIIQQAIQRIKDNFVEAREVTRTVLVIDEAQDMNQEEFGLIEALMEQNEEMRVIAVGDDDQNIYEFRGADSKYLEQFILKKNAIKHELTENFRSKNNLVDFTNQWVQKIQKRLKSIPIVSKQIGEGRIFITKYQSKNLIIPLVNEVMTADLSGTTCILTHSNEEALKITGLLLDHQLPAKLIQSNDTFDLINLYEVNFLLSIFRSNLEVFRISEELWELAKKELFVRFDRSDKLDIAKNLITDFEQTYPKVKYKSDLEIFARESRIEDFYTHQGETIFVSTIHKAKGKEFDNVFLLLENTGSPDDREKRLVYVGMTRAKNRLSIHLNGNYLDNLIAGNLQKKEDNQNYEDPNTLLMQLGFKDIWLGFSLQRQSLILPLRSGENLRLEGDTCTNSKGKEILKFSKYFLCQIDAMKQKGYELQSAKINQMVHWHDKETEKSGILVFPEVRFEKMGNLNLSNEN